MYLIVELELSFLHGDKKDSLTGKNLFNHGSWAKTKNTLKDVLMGNYIDPPSMSMSVHQLNKHG